MPLYEYQCPQDGTFEVIQKFSDAPLTACPTCGAEVTKLPSAPAIQFKGTGWYITDYARKGSGAEKGGSKDAAGGGDAAGGKGSGGTKDSGGAKDSGGTKESGATKDAGGAKDSGTSSSTADSKPPSPAK